MLDDVSLQQNDSSQTVEQLVLNKIEICYQHAECRLNRAFSRPHINFKQRGKAAGSARLQTNELRFNPVLLQENQQHFITHTVPHEVAHLLVYQLYGRTKPHGKEWATNHESNIWPHSQNNTSIRCLECKR